jgi:aldehyde:ferredoxin oxidoreductase
VLHVRGWDANGIPTTETLQKYGIEFLEPALAKLRA